MFATSSASYHLNCQCTSSFLLPHCHLSLSCLIFAKQFQLRLFIVHQWISITLQFKKEQAQDGLIAIAAVVSSDNLFLFFFYFFEMAQSSKMLIHHQQQQRGVSLFLNWLEKKEIFLFSFYPFSFFFASSLYSRHRHEIGKSCVDIKNGCGRSRCVLVQMTAVTQLVSQSVVNQIRSTTKRNRKEKLKIHGCMYSQFSLFFFANRLQPP